MPRPIDRPPRAVRLFDPVLRRLLRSGLPLGPNALITVRGRRSGELRSAGVAVLEINDHRWVLSAYGETNWVRNLRVASAATLSVRGRQEAVTARELPPAEGEAFFREELARYVQAFPLPVRLFGRIFVGEMLSDPAGESHRHPVFELI